MGHKNADRLVTFHDQIRKWHDYGCLDCAFVVVRCAINIESEWCAQHLDMRGRPGLLRTTLEAQETRGLTRSDDISRLLPSEASDGPQKTKKVA